MEASGQRFFAPISAGEVRNNGAAKYAFTTREKRGNARNFWRLYIAEPLGKFLPQRGLTREGSAHQLIMIKALATHRHMLSAGYFACFLALLATSVTAFAPVGVSPLHKHGLGMASLRSRSISQQNKLTVGSRPLAPANALTGMKALVSAEGRAAGRDILSRLKLSEVEQLFSKVCSVHMHAQAPMSRSIHRKLACHAYM